MTFLDKLEKRFGWMAIPNLGIFIVAGQVGIWAMAFLSNKPEILDHLFFSRDLVASQPWRLVSFILIPPMIDSFFLIFYWLLFSMFYSTLEQSWGSFKATMYIVVFIVSQVFCGLVFPIPFIIGGESLYMSIFFAFAVLHPNYELQLFFVLPVKVKWLALLGALRLVYEFLSYGLGTKLLILFSLANFILFFGKEFVAMMKQKQRKAAHQAKMAEVEMEAFHTCSVCGATDKTHPDIGFRYRGEECICEICIEKEKTAASSE